MDGKHFVCPTKPKCPISSVDLTLFIILLVASSVSYWRHLLDYLEQDYLSSARHFGFPLAICWYQYVPYSAFLDPLQNSYCKDTVFWSGPAGEILSFSDVSASFPAPLAIRGHYPNLRGLGQHLRQTLCAMTAALPCGRTWLGLRLQSAEKESTLQLWWIQVYWAPEQTDNRRKQAGGNNSL